MRKLNIILLCLSITITNVFASASSYQEKIKKQARSCFVTISKNRNKMPKEDIEAFENFLKERLNRDQLTRDIIQETYIEEINRLFDNNPLPEGVINVELENLRISGKKLNLDENVSYFSFKNCNLL